MFHAVVHIVGRLLHMTKFNHTIISDIIIGSDSFHRAAIILTDNYLTDTRFSRFTDNHFTDTIISPDMVISPTVILPTTITYT